MTRAFLVLAVLLMLVVPTALAVPRAVEAAESPITIFTKERGSLKPALYACYTLSVQGQGGRGAGCDNGSGGDEAADGKVVITPTGECGSCVVTQSLPDKPDGSYTDYLLEDPQITAPGGTLTFKNYLKPYMVVTLRNAKTGKLVKGGCIMISRPNVGGSATAACDGNANGGNADRDGRKNGKIKTIRLATPGLEPVTLNYRVESTTPWYTAKAVTVSAEPATTGKFEAVTLKLRRFS